jgi:hypothetical protein
MEADSAAIEEFLEQDISPFMAELGKRDAHRRSISTYFAGNAIKSRTSVKRFGAMYTSTNNE